MQKLRNKVAIVTGSGGGLGEAIGSALCQEGASVILNDVNEENVKTVFERLNVDHEVDYVAGDVSNKRDVDYIIDYTIQKYGKIDILVNNAGGSLRTPKDLDDIKEEDWDKVINVNLKGTFLTSQAVTKFMRKNGSGKIVNIASMAGRTPSMITGVAYAAAKGGVISFTRRLAKEVGQWNINVNAIAPGLIISGERVRHLFYQENTEEQRNQTLEEIALKQLGDKGDISNAVIYLASDDSKYMTGAVLDINGGRFIG